MKVSIITVSYNSANTIEETLKSVLHQSYQNIEYIVVDGDSKDGTVDLIKKYEKKFNGKMKWLSEKDEGIYDAMNKGIKLASGDIIGILNSDDIYYNNTVIENIVSIFQQSKADVVYSDVYFFNQSKDKIIRKWKARKGKVEYGWIPPHPGVFLKRYVYDVKGLFEKSFKIAADYDFLLRVFLDESLKKVYYQKCTVLMRYGGTSTGSIKNIVKGNVEILKSLKNNGISCPICVLFLRHMRKLRQFLRS
jgi:glycosyltransferase involved in cell wall biosynthesis